MILLTVRSFVINSFDKLARLDYIQTFISHVVKPTIICIFLSLALTHGWVIMCKMSFFMAFI